jgi:cytoskeletal protein CcmA (bactofilin family)
MDKTTISEDLKISGNLSGKARIEVSGQIDGDVEGSAVSVQSGGSISGAVKASTAQISGRLKGSVVAQTVELHSGAEVDADISAKELEIGKGAKIKGNVTVSGG